MADMLANLPLGTPLPLGPHGKPGPAGIVLETLAVSAATLVAGRDKAAVTAALSAAFGVDVVDAPVRVEAADVAFVGVGPGRWLVTATTNDLAARLAAAVGSTASVFEQSGGTVVMRASGPALPDFLARLVPLDCDEAVFAAGRAATTTLAHVGATLWREADGAFVFAVGRSYATAFLRTAAHMAAPFGLDRRS